MSNKASGSKAKVIVGSAKLMYAPLGTDLPEFTETTITWPVGWKEAGFTKDGLQVTNNPTGKDIEVDERSAPLYTFLDKEKMTLAAKLSQSDLTTLNLAMSASILTDVPATSTAVGIQTLEGGSGDFQQIMVAFEGLAPKKTIGGVLKNPWRVFIGYVAIARGNVSLSFKRAEETIVPVEFALYSDDTKEAGKDLYKVVDMTADKTA